uniref:Uncharacterized protein n=1 Tax=Avena sativa TaxID=4498 RepID=A0ACD5VDQ5_AVESA
MNASLAPVLRKFALVFFDDILIYNPTYEEHIHHIEAMLEIMQRDRWQVKPSKCEFAQQRIAYLGHVISGDGVDTDDSKITNITNWPVPKNLKKLRGFLGITFYYHKFIHHYAAFQTLKKALVSAPVLALPYFAEKFVIETDASNMGIGVVLS